MKTLYEVVKRPLVTEKSSVLKAEENQVVFEVAKLANKVEIKTAVETLFDVKVENVRTMIFRGKPKRVGRSMGRRDNWKKAVVTLAEGTDLDIFGPGTFEEPPEAVEE